MKLKKPGIKRYTHFANFKSIVPPTADTLFEYMPHATIGKDGCVTDEGYVRHEFYVHELDFISRCYDAWVARFSGLKREVAATKREEALRSFDELTLHRWKKKLLT